MKSDLIWGAALIVIGGLILISALAGKTGSIIAVFLAPGALNITNPIDGIYRTAQGSTSHA